MTNLNFNPARVGFGAIQGVVTALQKDIPIESSLKQIEIDIPGDNDTLSINNTLGKIGSITLKTNLNGKIIKKEIPDCDEILLRKVDKNSTVFVNSNCLVSIGTLADKASVTALTSTTTPKITINEIQGEDTEIEINRSTELTVEKPSTFNLMIPGRIQGVKAGDSPEKDYNCSVKITTHNRFNYLG